MDQSHSRLCFSAGAKLCDASLHSPCPIRICQRAGNIEAVFARQQIGDHDNGKPGLAFEKRLHHSRIKIFFEIDLVDLWVEAREDGDFRQIESRLWFVLLRRTARTRSRHHSKLFARILSQR